MNRRPNIAVLGSLNVDVTYRLARIPAPGETLSSRGAETSLGGKGANQALAARRAGAEVEMIGCVGSDDAGTRYRKWLDGAGIGTSGLRTVEGVTGSAVIFVDDQGENTIVVDAGANARVDTNQVETLRSTIEKADLLMMQLECSLEAVERAAVLAHEAGTPVMLNPSPWNEEFMRKGIEVENLVVNETETKRLLGMEELASELATLKKENFPGIGQLVITRGAESTLVPLGPDQVLSLEPPKVTPIDTVGAGDSFAGALAVALAEGRSLEEAVAFANVAGALATQLPGAQTAIPTREKIEESMGRESLP